MTRRPSASVVIVVLALCACLSACSAAGSITCDEFQASESNDQYFTERSLLREHGANPDSAQNIYQLRTTIAEFCGMLPLPGFPDEPTQNQDQPISDAVDWDAVTWS
jgi:hypothetical protein